VLAAWAASFRARVKANFLENSAGSGLHLRTPISWVEAQSTSSERVQARLPISIEIDFLKRILRIKSVGQQGNLG